MDYHAQRMERPREEYVRQIAASWTSGLRALQEKRATEKKRAEDQLRQLIRMKMEDLITDDEFRRQRVEIVDRISGLDGGIAENEISPDVVLASLDTVTVPLGDLASSWIRIKTENRLKFQHLVLPSGYVFGSVGTAPKGRLFSFFESLELSNTNGVPLTGLCWNQLADEIEAFAAIFGESAI